jgi:Uma2 family endonuclease
MPDPASNAIGTKSAQVRTNGDRAVRFYNGDRMSRDEFHRLYEETPEDFRAELIGGIVYVTPPRCPIAHGKARMMFCSVLVAYEVKTPGVDGCAITTVLLGDDSEPEPDLHLRILPEYGGQTTISTDDYLAGAPEFIVEVVHSSNAIELHAKKDDYIRFGVREYLVACIREQQLRWFDLTAGTELKPDAAGIYRMKTFPGLWINAPAVLAHNYAECMKTLEEGLATPEHAAFVRELQARRSKS